MPENPASYRVVRTKSYLFNKAERTLKARKDKAKYWLMQWPSQLPLIS
ncbi:TPA: hypothetical protein MFN53_004753 [Klebsiella pneumoniae]|nr:hypothetical protein [Klebsiella pneumoniae]